MFYFAAFANTLAILHGSAVNCCYIKKQKCDASTLKCIVWDNNCGTLMAAAVGGGGSM